MHTIPILQTLKARYNLNACYSFFIYVLSNCNSCYKSVHMHTIEIMCNPNIPIQTDHQQQQKTSYPQIDNLTQALQ